MSTSLGISARLARSTKKQDVPYAFNCNSSNSTSTALVNKLKQEGQFNAVENVMHTIEQVSTLLTSGFDHQIKDSILNMCQHLKVYGACLEILYKEQLDRAFVEFRNSSQNEEKLDYQSRLHLLELIELRANQWKGTDVMSQYYKKKSHIENENIMLNDGISSNDSSAFLSPLSPPLLGPGEVMKSSGKFAKPTRIPGKNYCKDEVVIRNSDSGKVNPGAKERLVQITGASETSINHAKQLIEDTIRRNASPIRDPNAGVGALAGSSSSINSSASDDCALPIVNTPRGHLLHSLSTGDANFGEYKFTVFVDGKGILKITGSNLELVKQSKIILDEYFSRISINGVDEYNQFETFRQSPTAPDLQQTDHITDGPLINETPPDTPDYKPLRRPNSFIEEPKVKDSGIRYNFGMLLNLANSPYCLESPQQWENILVKVPYIARKVVQMFDAEAFLSSRAQVSLCTSASDDSILSGSSI